MPPSDSASPTFDPYEPRPTFIQQHSHAVAAAAVFVLTVFLGVAAFPPYKAPEFAYAMLVPGIYWAYTRPTFKLYAATMLGAQMVLWTILLGWLHHVTWFGLFLLGPFVGVWVGVWYLAAWWTLPRILGKPTPTRLLVICGLAGGWVLIEWTRTWLLGGFPWLPLSASQWERASILQIASYTGAYGISFVLVMMNLGFGAYAHRLFREGVTGINKRSQEFFLALFLLLACVSVHFQESFNRRGFTAPLARIAVVQPYIPQDVKWDPSKAKGILEILQRTTLEAAASRPELIIWPESVMPLAVRSDPGAKAFVLDLVKRTNVPLLLGSNAIEGQGTPKETWFNAAVLVTPEDGVLPRYYAKRQLVPFGEFVPFRPVLGWLNKFVPIGEGDFGRGETASPLIVPIRGRPIVMAPLICYEDVYPGLARESVAAGSNALVVMTNNGWFGEGGAAYQHAAHSVLRAVETRRPLIRCGNGGWSGWIDEFGVTRPVKDEKGTIYFRGSRSLDVTRDMRWTATPSFYTRHGDWFVLVCVALMSFSFALLRIAGMPARRIAAQ